MLADAGVSAQWIDPLAAMAAERGGDAVALLAAVAPGPERSPRLQRLRRRVIDRVRQHLDAAGHIDSRPPLDDDAIVHRAMVAAAGAALPARAGRTRMLALPHVARASR